MPIRLKAALGAAVLMTTPVLAFAQSLGTFRWQLQPFCNAVTVTVTQEGGAYTVDGFDDQCGAPQRAPLVGLATPNPDGTIGFGLHIVTVPGGRPVTVDARISIATLGGSWTDSAGNAGTFAFNGNASGAARPAPPAPSMIPATFTLRADGGFVAGGVMNGVATGIIPATGAGVRTMWFPGKAAFRAGNVLSGQPTVWDDVNVGYGSAAFNVGTIARGFASTAFGSGSAATGNMSLAAGDQAVASGDNSTAFGWGTVASGAESAAFGTFTRASGLSAISAGNDAVASGMFSLAVGLRTEAAGEASIALGADTSAAGARAVAIGLRNHANGNGSVALGSDAVAVAAATGSFVFSDRSSTDQTFSVNPNEFIVRAHGGTAFYVNGGASFHTGNGGGVRVAPNGSQWLTLSDANSKEHFRDLDDNDVLARIARMPVTEWSYKAQDTAIRHVGPTAQDFHAAFGLGEDPLRIGSADASGVALAAVRALEARTRALQDENRVLREALDTLRRELTALAAK